MKRNTSWNAWTKKELAALRTTWPNRAPDEVWRAVGKAGLYSSTPFRKWASIKKMASRMGLRKSAQYRKRVLHLSK